MIRRLASFGSRDCGNPTCFRRLIPCFGGSVPCIREESVSLANNRTIRHPSRIVDMISHFENSTRRSLVAAFFAFAAHATVGWGQISNWGVEINRDPLYVSYDKGTTWRSVSNGLSNDVEVSFVEQTDSGLFVATDDAGIFCQPENGTVWTKISDGLPSEKISAPVCRKDGNPCCPAPARSF